MVEQGTHKPLVGGSNPPSATNHRSRRCGPPVRRGRIDSFTFRRDTIRSPATSVQPVMRPRTSVTGCSGALDAILGPTGGARPSPARPRRLPLNPKFFRNGIVMLVLVVGHRRAAVHVDAVARSQTDPGRLLAVPRPTSATARSTAVSPAGRDAHGQAQAPDRQTYTVTVPSDPDPGLPRHAARRPRPAARTLSSTHLQGRARAGHVVARAAPDRAPAADLSAGSSSS